MRRLADRIEQAMEAAPPEKAAAMIPRLTELAGRLADAEAREADETFSARQRDYDAEVERLISARAAERMEALIRPPRHDFENEARRIAWREGGAWEDQMERVLADHRDFVRRLLTVPDGVSFAEHLEGEARAGCLWARGW